MLRGLEQRPDLRLVKLADAAHDNCELSADELAPQADSSTDLVDFFQLLQLKAATDAATVTTMCGDSADEKYRPPATA